MACVTENRKPNPPADGPPRPRPGPAGPEFDAYAKLPPPSRIAQQLRHMDELARDFQAHLGRALDCNPTDLAAMQHLIVAGPLSPGELSKRLGVTSAAGTMVVDRLVGLGHVQREPHEADRRRTVVHPTGASVSRAIDELMPVVAGIDAIVSELSESERRIVEGFLDKVVAVYGDALAAGRGRKG